VQQAHNEIDRAVTEAISKHPDLTYLETLAILNQVAASWMLDKDRNSRGT
jgi:hypothetical protein